MISLISLPLQVGQSACDIRPCERCGAGRAGAGTTCGDSRSPCLLPSLFQFSALNRHVLWGANSLLFSVAVMNSPPFLARKSWVPVGQGGLSCEFRIRCCQLCLAGCLIGPGGGGGETPRRAPASSLYAPYTVRVNSRLEVCESALCSDISVAAALRHPV